MPDDTRRKTRKQLGDLNPIVRATEALADAGDEVIERMPPAVRRAGRRLATTIAREVPKFTERAKRHGRRALRSARRTVRRVKRSLRGRR